MDTRWSIKVRHTDHETTQSSLSPSIALSNKDDARRWTCQTISFHERLLRCCAFRCKFRPRGLITSTNMVDVSDVTTCQNKHARVFCVCDVTDGQKSLVGTFWSWSHKTSNYVDLMMLLDYSTLQKNNNYTTVVWYKKKKRGKSTLSKSERKTVLQLASFIPG